MTGPDGGPGSRTAGPDVVLTYGFDTLADAAARGWMRPPDRLASYLAGDPGTRRLLVADPARSVLGLLRPGSGVRAVPPGALPGRSTVSPRRLARRDPAGPVRARRSAERYDRQLQAAAARAGLVDPVLITCHPCVAAWAPARWASAVVYYARDDWAAHPSYARVAPAVRASYAELRRGDRKVAAVGQVLLEAVLGEEAGRGVVVPNGVDPRLWRAESRVPSWAAHLPRPLAVYAGSLDSRLDVEAVTALSRSGVVDVALVGPVMDPGALAPLAGLPRVHLLGNQPHHEVAAFLRVADVALLLHRDTALTRAMDPLKLYEYLAAGLPVVASDLPQLRGRGAAVTLCAPGQDVVPLIVAAAGRSRPSEEERLREVERLSWDGRFRTLVGYAMAP